MLEALSMDHQTEQANEDLSSPLLLDFRLSVALMFGHQLDVACRQPWLAKVPQINF
jgi:hypothetical protein